LKRTAQAAIVLLGASLIAAACGGDNKDSSSTTVSPATTSASGASTSAGGAATTASGASGGTITYSLPDRFTSYNNGTADDNLTSNQYATNQVIPQVAYFDEKGGFTVNKDLVDIEKTSESPLTVV